MKGKTMHYLEVEMVNGRYVFFDQDGDAYDYNGELTPENIREIKFCTAKKKRVVRLVTSDADGSLERFGTASYKFFHRNNAVKTKTLPYLTYVDLDDENPVITVDKTETVAEKTQVTAQ